MTLLGEGLRLGEHRDGASKGGGQRLGLTIVTKRKARSVV